MTVKFGTHLLAEDLIVASQKYPNIQIKRFPSNTPDIIVINPFIVKLELNQRKIDLAFSYKQYPSSIFPKILFFDIPQCPLHPEFHHPNINLSNGRLNLTPTISTPQFHVEHSIELMLYILNNPIHYSGACTNSFLTDLVGNLNIPQFPRDKSLTETIKNIGEVVRTIKTVIEIGQTFASIISLF